MAPERFSGDFPDLADENRRIWDANARWWDDRIGDGNEFQTELIEPATERLLRIRAGDTILDVACGAGRFARRMADRGARVVAIDSSRAFIARARERTAIGAAIDYHVLDAANLEPLVGPGVARFDKAVCTMALMDMAQIGPLFTALARVLTPGGWFVFSVAHPCFHSSTMSRVAEISEKDDGRHVARTGVTVWAYLSPLARKTEGIVGQPEPQWCFHRPLGLLLQAGFDAGFVVDGFEEPRFAITDAGAGLRWQNMPDIPPIVAIRMRLG